MSKSDKIAKKIVALKIDTKQDFLEFLASSIKNVEFVFEDNSIVASKKKKEEDLDITFIKLKNKIEEWIAETNHTQPFYPRDFIKRILKSNATFTYVKRTDNADKMRPADYELSDVNDMRKFLLSRIDRDDEQTGLKFKENTMGVDHDGMPLDVYNAIRRNFRLDKDSKLYLKFSVNKSLDKALFDMKFISIHDEGV